MQKDLVSLLTPMYNTEKYVHRLLDSVLMQTYPKIEMIVIDDGSTDDSRTVVENYVEKFEKRGYTLNYVWQENSGQSVAIKNGLYLINGEYLAWPDSDDYYATNDAIERMVAELKSSSDDFKMVRTQERILIDGTLKPKGISGENAKKEEDHSLFEDCLLAKNDFFFCPGAYMVESQALYEMTNYDIYTAKDAGQNWQLMLPILYKYRCKTILEPLYNVIERADSHSRGQYRGYVASVRKYVAYLDTQIETLRRIKGIKPEDIELYKAMLEKKYNENLLYMAIGENNRKEALHRLNAVQSGGGYFCQGEVTRSVATGEGGHIRH